MESPLLSRKFILAIVLIVSITVSFWMRLIPADQYLYGLGFAIAVYTGANVIQKKIDNK